MRSFNSNPKPIFSSFAFFLMVATFALENMGYAVDTLIVTIQIAIAEGFAKLPPWARMITCLVSNGNGVGENNRFF